MKFFRRLLFLSLVFLILIMVVNIINKGVNVIHPKGVQTSSIRPSDNPSTSLPSDDLRVNRASQYSFAVISDIHTDIPNLQKTLNRIKSDGINFFIVAGDLTKVGKKTEMLKVKTVLDQSGIPYYVIPGNHDLWSAKSAGNPFKEVFGVDYQVFLKDNVKFILVNNGDGVVGVDETQRNWLKQQLSDCPKIYCLVFMHMPLNNPMTKHIMGEDSLAVSSQAALLIKELVDKKVKQLFAGHIHYLSTYTLDGLKTTTDGVVYSSGVKASARFIEVKITQPETVIEEKQIWLD